jgi:large subunit ribosomal protein L18e
MVTFKKDISIRPSTNVGRVRTMTPQKTDPNLVALITGLKAETRASGADIWRDIALRLEKPRQNWAEVNLSKLERYASEGDIIVVAGKVLGSGTLSKKLTVAAYDFSESAKKKIAEAGGKGVSIPELIKMSPNGSGVRIMR